MRLIETRQSVWFGSESPVISTIYIQKRTSFALLARNKFIKHFLIVQICIVRMSIFNLYICGCSCRHQKFAYNLFFPNSLFLSILISFLLTSYFSNSFSDAEINFFVGVPQEKIYKLYKTVCKFLCVVIFQFIIMYNFHTCNT